MDVTKISVVSLVVAIVAMAVAFSFGGTPRDGKDGKDGVSVGAVASLENVDVPFMGVNGVKQYFHNQAISATSSTICSVKNPFAATSTLMDFSVLVSTNGLGSQKIDIATSTTNLGTSTLMYIKEFTTGTGQFSLDYNPGTTTNTRLIGLNAVTGVNDAIVAPGQFVNAKISSGTPGTFAGGYFTGRCTAVFKSL